MDKNISTKFNLKVLILPIYNVIMSKGAMQHNVTPVMWALPLLPNGGRKPSSL